MNCKTSCIIVTYNALRNNWLRKCLDSVLNSSMQSYIIVVDNASTDDTVKIIKDEYPKVHIIENSQNQGFGKANNQGFEIALKNGCEYFFLLNQDATVETKTLERLVNIHSKNTNYGIVSPMHFNGSKDELDFNFSNYISPDHCKNLYSDYVTNTVKNQIYESGFICAAAWLISKACLEKVGGFSPIFFHYAEDDNYIHRLFYKKMKIGVYPFANIYHDREARVDNQFFESEKHKKRLYVLQQSNPNRELTLDKEIIALKRKLVKYSFLLDFKTIAYLKKEIKFRISILHDLVSQRENSKQNSKFVFLDYND